MRTETHQSHFVLMILSLVLQAQPVFAQDDVSDTPVSTSETISAEPKKSQSGKRMTKKPSEYRVSRYTSDRSEQEADQVQVWLGVGLDRIFDLDPEVKLGDRTGSILESNTNIVKVVPVSIGEKKQLIFKGLAEGNATVTIRDKAGLIKILYNVTVAKQDLIRMMDDLKRDLKEVEGIDIRIQGARIVVSGEVLTPNDYGAVVNVITDKTFIDAVSNRIVMSPVTLNALADKIQKDIQNGIAKEVTTRVLNGKIILEGVVNSPGLRDRVLRRAEWYLPTTKVSDPINKDTANIEKNDKPLQIIQSDIQVVAEQPKRETKLLRLSVYFVELSKDFLKSFGFKWQPGFTADPSISIGTSTTGGAATSDSGGFTFSGTLSSLFPALSSTPASSAYGRILKSATIVVKSQEKAKLKDVQQIPTQTLGQNGTVGIGTPVTVGFDLEITPTIMQGKDVDMHISLDQNNALGKGLGGSTITANHHVETRLYLKDREVGAVAGVNNSDTSTTFNRDDPNSGTLTNAKPLFTLQRSKGMSKKKGQFVVFVSPEILESASEGTEDLKKNFRMKSNQ